MTTPETIIGPDKWEYVKLTEWEKQADRIATFEAELLRLKAENHRLLTDLEKQSARADRIEKELATATAPHVDDAGLVWHVPTAWAYAQACNGRNTRAERAEALVRELVEVLEESDEYLTPKVQGQVNTISTKSILHSKFIGAIAKAKEAGL